MQRVSVVRSAAKLLHIAGSQVNDHRTVNAIVTQHFRKIGEPTMVAMVILDTRVLVYGSRNMRGTSHLKEALRAVRPIVKDIVSVGSYRLGLYHAVGSVYGGMGVIFMFHRVVPRGLPILYPGFSVPVEAVEELLQTVRGLGWDMISLAEVHDRLHRRDPRRFAAFSFDDGYLDNLNVALPVFRTYGAPMCVNIVPAALDRTMGYWWGGLEEIALRNEVIDVPGVHGGASMRLWARTLKEKRHAFDQMDNFCHSLTPAELADFSAEMFDRYDIEMPALLDRDFLSDQQARKLASDPLVSIGGHSMTHRRLSDLSDEEVEREIEPCRRVLENRLSVSVDHFAFPFGGSDSCGEREFALAKQAGFKTAVTTRRGNLFADHKHYCECLPRRLAPMTRVQSWNALFGYETVQKRARRFQAN